MQRTRQHQTQDTERRKIKQTVITQKTKTMKVESRDSDNIRHKTQNNDKRNRSDNTENKKNEGRIQRHRQHQTQDTERRQIKQKL